MLIVIDPNPMGPRIVAPENARLVGDRRNQIERGIVPARRRFAEAKRAKLCRPVDLGKGPASVGRVIEPFKGREPQITRTVGSGIDLILPAAVVASIAGCGQSIR